MHLSISKTIAAALLLASSSTAQSASNGNLIGLTARGTRLVRFDAGAPSRILGVSGITGLNTGERIVGIDARPATGELYGVGTSNRLYVIDPDSGAATPVGMGPFTTALSGLAFGIDFNPTVDRIRLVSDADQNLRLNPDTGAVAAVDTNLAYAMGDPAFGADPRIVAEAYTSSFAGSTATTLFAIDADRDALVTQGSANGSPVSPNTGQLFTVGALGIDTLGIAGFDVSPLGGAFAAFNAPGDTVTKLYTIDLATGTVTLLGALGGGVRLSDLAVRPVSAPRMFAVTSAHRLVSFRPGNPGTLLGDVAITGLAAGEDVLGIDFRPATGELVALGSSSRLYEIDAATGVAVPVGSAPFTPALAGAAFGVDFNPAVDRLRVVSDADQNLRLDPATGTVAGTDTNLAYAAGDANFGADPRVVGSAYTNNFAGTGATTLFGIDSDRDVLVTQGSANGSPVSPNTGQLFTIGALGVDANDGVGFDVSTFGGAFAVLTPASASSAQLFSVNLGTGAATLVGTIGSGLALRGFAIEPPLAPIAYAVTVDGLLASFRPGKPGAILASVPVRGIRAGESLVGLDFRPATGTLFAVGSSNRLYQLDRASGAATQIGAGPFSPGLAGMDFGVDFNPVVDRLRVVSDAGQNLRLDPASGAVASVDALLGFAAGDPNAAAVASEVAVAYTKNFTGSTSTTLFGIDSVLDVLVTQGSPGGSPVSPNTGMLFTVGSLGFDTSGSVGFDITSFGGAFASVTAPGASSSQLATLNLTTGAATLAGAIGTVMPVRDIAFLPAGL